MPSLLTLATGAAIAFANGANDNFKGVATLRGSKTTGYRYALLWATLTTALGSLAALILARGLLETFSGKGLVPAGVAADPSFAVAVMMAAGATVLLATRLGLPVSTTHALVGALVGAGWVASSVGVDTTVLGQGLLAPLLVSPLLAVLLAVGTYPVLAWSRRIAGVSSETCVCVGEQIVGVVPGAPGARQALRAVGVPALGTGTAATCRDRYRGRVLGIRARPALDTAHFLSAGAVSFARGVNDTPKIAALLLVGGAMSPSAAILAVAVAMALGGWVGARRVATTLSWRVTEMNPGQGFTANLVTALAVIGASRFGLPVSTTHVSCGALFGIGMVTRRARWRMILGILLAWAVTLPLAAGLGAGFAAAFAAGR